MDGTVDWDANKPDAPIAALGIALTRDPVEVSLDLVLRWCSFLNPPVADYQFIIIIAPGLHRLLSCPPVVDWRGF